MSHFILTNQRGGRDSMEERESQGIEVIFERENVGGNEETGNPFTQILIQTEFKTAIMKLPMCI